MIDFRYHVVSLISVFLALAVGIALGAGPLKETIGDTLTGQGTPEAIFGRPLWGRNVRFVLGLKW